MSEESAAAEMYRMQYQACVAQLGRITESLEGLEGMAGRLSPGAPGAESFARMVLSLCTEVEKSLPAMREYLEELELEEDPGAVKLRQMLEHLESDLLTPLLGFARRTLP